MFELVIENKGTEYVAHTAEQEREVALVYQCHVRSLASGTATIREAKATKKAKKQ